MARNPSMPKSEAFAIATQQMHAAGKSPKGYGTAEGRSTAKAKYDEPKSHYTQTADPEKTAGRVFVGNLPHDISHAELHAHFSSHGQVKNVNLPKDKATGNPRGFAIVTMGSPKDARKAMTGLHGKDLGSGPVRVHKEKTAFSLSSAALAGFRDELQKIANVMPMQQPPEALGAPKSTAPKPATSNSSKGPLGPAKVNAEPVRAPNMQVQPTLEPPAARK